MKTKEHRNHQVALCHLMVIFCLLVAQAAIAQESYNEIRKLILSDAERASAKLDTFQQEAIATQNDSLMAKSLYLRGLLNYFQGRYYIAADYYKRTLTHTAYLSQNTYLHEGIWNNLGVCYELVDDLDEAFVAYDKSLELAIERGDSQGIAMSWINLGLLAVNQNNLDAGKKYLSLAEAYFESRPEEGYNRGLVYNNLALYHEKKASSAGLILEYNKKAINTFSEIGDTINLLLAMGNYVVAQVDHAKDANEARRWIEAIHDMESQYAIPPALKAFLWRVEGEYKILIGEYQQGKALFEQALTFYKAQLNEFEVRRVYSGILLALAGLNDFEAYKAANSASKMAIEQVERERTKARYEELAILHDVKRKEKTIRTLDSRVQWLDQTLDKALRTSKIKTVLIIGLLLVLTLVGAAIFITQQQQHLKGLQRVLFRMSRREKAARTTLPEDATSDDAHILALYQRLEAYFQSERPYLDPSYDLKALCVQLNTNPAYASRAINAYSGGNFNQYINAYRVAFAKDVLESYESSGATINAISQQSGFNSYATFRRAFKVETGLTPSQYLKMLAAEE